MAAKTITQTEPEAQKLHPCACAAFEVEVGHDAETMDYKDTGCGASTTRVFAPGHDAKLKSLLIWAGARDYSVRYTVDGIASIADATVHAAKFDFSYMVQNGIKRELAKAQERADARAERDAKKAAAPAKRERKAKRAAAKQATEVTIKVGRWVYPATIDESNNATYTTSAGETKTAPEGKYQVV